MIAKTIISAYRTTTPGLTLFDVPHNRVPRFRRVGPQLQSSYLNRTGTFFTVLCVLVVLTKSTFHTDDDMIALKNLNRQW
jgi:hypothetical protein